jgi:predicted phosphodiesterase
MRTLFLSDFHFSDPIPFIKRKIDEGITKLVCLGDYDNPKILEDILNLDIEKIITIGNHDYNFVKGNLFYSPLLKHPFEYYAKLWEDSGSVRDFVLKASEKTRKNTEKDGLLVVESLNEKKVACCHGSLVSYDSIPLIYGRMKRPLEIGVVRDNFREMQKNDFWILFRGHDHSSEALSLELDVHPYMTELTEEKTPLHLDAGKRYIISIGGFYQGLYATLDNESLLFNFGDIRKP